jgi:hypothetical protein
MEAFNTICQKENESNMQQLIGEENEKVINSSKKQKSFKRIHYKMGEAKEKKQYPNLEVSNMRQREECSQN